MNIFYIPALQPLPARALPDTEPDISARVKEFINGLQKQSAIDTSTLPGELARRYNKDGARWRKPFVVKFILQHSLGGGKGNSVPKTRSPAMALMIETGGVSLYRAKTDAQIRI